MYICICICIRIRICICICMHVCMYACMHVCNVCIGMYMTFHLRIGERNCAERNRIAKHCAATFASCTIRARNTQCARNVGARVVVVLRRSHGVQLDTTPAGCTTACRNQFAVRLLSRCFHPPPLPPSSHPSLHSQTFPDYKVGARLAFRIPSLRIIAEGSMKHFRGSVQDIFTHTTSGTPAQSRIHREQLQRFQNSVESTFSTSGTPSRAPSVSQRNGSQPPMTPSCFTLKTKWTSRISATAHFENVQGACFKCTNIRMTSMSPYVP